MEKIMNNSKKTLILVSGILAIIQGVALALMAIFIKPFLDKVLEMAVMNDPTIAETDLSLIRQQLELMQSTLQVFCAIFAITSTLGGIFSLVSTSNFQHFEEKKGLYITGAVFTIISNPLSISSILLYISFGMPTKVKTQQNPSAPISPEPTKNYSVMKDEIEVLRKLKEDGVITEEEFKKQILEILNKKMKQ